MNHRNATCSFTTLLMMTIASLSVVGCATMPQPPGFEPGQVDTTHLVLKVDAVVLVVDGSLSMAGLSERQGKLEIATDAASSLARTVPDGELDGGVRSFGQGRCLPDEPTSSLYGIGSYSAAAADAAVERISCAGGPSPLDAALTAIGDDLGPDADGMNGVAVFIFSDGRHMCERELEAARQLKSSLGDGLCLYPVLVGDNIDGREMMAEIGRITECSGLIRAMTLTAPSAMAHLVETTLFEPDADGDGVADRLDTCPDTPSGVEVDEAGCPLDSDGDGVADHLDRCPDTPAGTEVDATGCPMDADSDGVADADDRCPRTPAGVKVDEAGCPLDSDGDDVADHLDRCPGTPAGTPVDSHGCPIAGIQVVADEWQVSGEVLFDLNRDEIKAAAKPVLDQLATWLIKHPEVDVLVTGHTDDTGSESWNQKLSARRAVSAAAYLEQQGVAKGRLSTDGKGESAPFVPNDSEANRARNRRVTFKPSR